MKEALELSPGIFTHVSAVNDFTGAGLCRPLELGFVVTD